MRNKQKQKLKKRHQEFQKNLDLLYAEFDKNYPGWREGKDADYIKRRLRDNAKQQQKNIHKKKTKLLKKENFPDWPFTVDEIILVQTSKKMISCIVKKKGISEYALNGLAATGLKLKFAHDSGIAVVGKSVGEFIKIGMGL